VAEARAAVVRIDLPAREGGPYEVVICDGDGPAHLAAAALRFGDRPRFLIADEHVAELHGAAFRAALGEPPMVLMPPGEWCKSLAAVERAAASLIALGAGRDAVLFALGGGALCDAAGFIAATLQRGVDHVLVPSTLLAMVDASVGGKTAVNLYAGKNMLGVFHQPRLVIADLQLLATLSVRDRRAGLGEILKHAMLEGERALDKLEAQATQLRDETPAAMVDVVRRAVAYKAKIVATDPRETRVPQATKSSPRKNARRRAVPLDGREILNLGHTVGHALEAASHVSGFALRHGEAVALGLLAEAHIGRTLNLWPKGPDRLLALLPRLGLPYSLADALRPLSVELLRSALLSDKKRKGGQADDRDKLRLVLLDGPGRPLGVSLSVDRALEILVG
jgi:3-dehydroquinate synthetase